MTQEEQDALLGRTRREYKAARSKLGALKKRNEGIATSAENLMNAVRKHPSRILVPTKGQLGREGNLSRTLKMASIEFVYGEEDSDLLSPDFLRTHFEEYASAEQQVDRLRQELIEQGDDDPEE
jgi:hypothetical protein